MPAVGMCTRNIRQVALFGTRLSLSSECFRGLLIVMNSAWWFSWNGCVLETDASLDGSAIAQSCWPRRLVAQVGRVSERSRFMRTSPRSARQSALCAALLERGPDGERHSSVTESGTPLGMSWSMGHHIARGAVGTAQKKPTGNCQTGNWKHDEDVRVLEARVLVKGIQRLAGTSFVCCTRQLLLCDSTGAVLSFQRLRSSSLKLLTPVRRFQACALALESRTSLRWVPLGIERG